MARGGRRDGARGGPIPVLNCIRNEQMVTPAGSCPAGSPAAAALGASENGLYVAYAHDPAVATAACGPSDQVV